MELSGKLHTPAALPPGVTASGTHWIGRWVGPRAGQDAVAKQKGSPFTARAWNLNPGRPAHSLVTITTELLRLLKLINVRIISV
jgi:hypothetical protein